MSRGVLTSDTVVPFSSVYPLVAISVPDSVSFTMDLVVSMITSVEVRSEVNVIIFIKATFSAVLAPFAESSLERLVFVVYGAPFSTRGVCLCGAGP